MSYNTQIREFITRIAPDVLSDEASRLWNEWLDFSGRQSQLGLKTLLASDVRIEFKIRALVVFLAPDLRVLPFRWDDTKGTDYNYLSLLRLEAKDVPRELLDFAVELICHNVDHVFGDENQDMRMSLFGYNGLILGFLAALPEDHELAGRLFERYQINDPVAYMSMEDQSGYNPLLNIFCATDIPEKWKVIADSRMRDRVIAENDGQEKPRESWEAALQRYVYHIQTSNYDGRMGYSSDLLASQIRFIVELPGIEAYDFELFASRQLIHIMGAISGDLLRETRHRLARLIVLREGKAHFRFSVEDHKSRRAASLMLREFGAEDKELADKLNALVAEWERRAASAAEARRMHSQGLEETMNRMK